MRRIDGNGMGFNPPPQSLPPNILTNSNKYESLNDFISENQIEVEAIIGRFVTYLHEVGFGNVELVKCHNNINAFIKKQTE